MANWARPTLLALARRQPGGTLVITEAGRQHRLGSGPPSGAVTVHDPRVYGALLGRGSVGLGQSYVAGWWDSDDLTAVVQTLLRWTSAFRGALDRVGRTMAPLDLPVRWLGGPGRAQDQQNVRAHYDLSNEFFELMLDETMSYSCAVFESPDMTLAEAQRAKIDRLCVKLDLQPGQRLIEIGSGWGGLALHAASHYGCEVTTTTISEAQRTYVAKRVADAGLDGQVFVLGQDWRDLRGTYDRLVSVEMVEAVDWRHHDRFMATCAGLLKKEGLAALQAIVIDDRSFDRAKWHQDFVRRMVFPGSCIPSVTSLTASLRRATDMRLVDLEDIGCHYAETLARWADNLSTRSAQVDRLGLGSELRRLWSLYLAYCEASFREAHISDVQVLLAKPGWRGRLKARQP
jgi:cyclopropane-fatty-acyl-phospholipid synthase